MQGKEQAQEKVSEEAQEAKEAKEAKETTEAPASQKHSFESLHSVRDYQPQATHFSLEIISSVSSF